MKAPLSLMMISNSALMVIDFQTSLALAMSGPAAVSTNIDATGSVGNPTKSSGPNLLLI